MKRNVSVVKLCLYVSECVCSKIIKELSGLVGSGTPYIFIADCIRSHRYTLLARDIISSNRFYCKHDWIIF